MKRNSSINIRSRRQSAFTLIEMMVALAIFMVLMVVIFVPINLGVNLTHIGTARADVQQAGQQMLNRITTDLRQAVYVFPNEAMPGVTDRAPYTNNRRNIGDLIGHPYYQTDSTVCGSISLTGANGAVAASNTSRIDFLLPQRNNNGLVTPVTGERYVVSYYARRLDARAAWNQRANSYNPTDNPIMLFRAQMPYLNFNEVDLTDRSNRPNLYLDSRRYPTNCGTATQANNHNRGTLWLAQNGGGEPNLELPASTEDTVNTPPNSPPASHQLITPRTMALMAPRAALENLDPTKGPVRNYQPETTFLCEDMNSDGKIDRVTVTLVIGQFDEGAVENRPQPLRLTQVVDLPNIR